MSSFGYLGDKHFESSFDAGETVEEWLARLRSSGWRRDDTGEQRAIKTSYETLRVAVKVPSANRYVGTHRRLEPKREWVAWLKYKLRWLILI